MRISSLSLLALAGMAAGLAAPIAARADQTLITIADPDVVLDVAKGYGSANMDKDEDGNPKISGRLEGVKYVI
jgi:hypothetical protein